MSYLGVDMDRYLGHVRGEAETAFGEVYQSTEAGMPGGMASNRNYPRQALAKTGSLSMEGYEQGSDANSVRHCWQTTMGAGINTQNPDSGQHQAPGQGCGAGTGKELTMLSVQPAHGESGLAPNTAMAVEATRAILTGEFPMLTVIRGDLAWLRDNPEALTPMRMPRNNMAPSTEQLSELSNQQQRVGAILAYRGLGAMDFDFNRPDPATVRGQEDQAKLARTLAQLAYLYDSLAQYPLSYAGMMPIRETLTHKFTADTIDGASEGSRYALGVRLAGLEAHLDTLVLESRGRQERLQGMLLSDYQQDDVDDLMQKTL
jgi:hypothetical protein